MHDPLCQADPLDDIYFCVCEFIAKVRADERAKRINPYDDYTIHQISDAALADLRSHVQALPTRGIGARVINGELETFGLVERAEVLDLIDGRSDG